LNHKKILPQRHKEHKKEKEKGEQKIKKESGHRFAQMNTVKCN
jgi:hypothetical protein